MLMAPSELLFYGERCDRAEVLQMMFFICNCYSKTTNIDLTHVRKQISMKIKAKVREEKENRQMLS